MNQNLISGLGILVVGVAVILSQTLFTVHQVEQALVVQLGEPKRVIREPGLNYKIPFLEVVHSFDRRLLDFDSDPQEVLSSDKKNLKVDNYARWRIIDPLKYYQTVRNEPGAHARLNDIIYSNLREVLGQFTMMEIVGGSRTDLMKKIREQANEQASQYGIEVVDVRIKRTDLPAENSKAVYRRMQTERERQAKQYRAQGNEQAVRITSAADRDREVLLAEAYHKAQKLRGEGDAQATHIYAEAYNRDPRLYEFVRTLEVYRKGMVKDTTLVLKPDARFLQLFKDGPRDVHPPGQR